MNKKNTIKRIEYLTKFKKHLKNKKKRVLFLNKSTRSEIDHICECILPSNLLNLKKNKKINKKLLSQLKKKNIYCLYY